MTLAGPTDVAEAAAGQVPAVFLDARRFRPRRPAAGWHWRLASVRGEHWQDASATRPTGCRAGGECGDHPEDSRGARGPRGDIVILNAAAALWTVGKDASLDGSARLAARAIDSGAAADLLARLVAMTNARFPLPPGEG